MSKIAALPQALGGLIIFYVRPSSFLVYLKSEDFVIESDIMKNCL